MHKPSARRSPQPHLNLHDWQHDALVDRLTELIRSRLSGHVDLGRTPSRGDVADLSAISAQGIGVDAALQLVEDVLLPNNVSLDHPNFLAYIPASPAPSSVLFDALVAAWTFSAESWQEAGAAVAAENATLDWLASLADLPAGAGGCFVSGGSAGNLSGLAVARDRARRNGLAEVRVACAESAHSSVRNAAALLDMEVVVVPGDERGRLTGSALGAVDAHDVGAVVATAGATNSGAVDDLSGVADVCRANGWWLHVDGAYGGAALCVDEFRPQFAGIEHADSLVVDPHKWLFAPLDCAALLFADPGEARLTHRQTASYIDAFGDEQWNPSDYAFHLTRRARGLPLWFSLVAHGVDAYAAAVRRGVELAQEAARMITEAGPPLELVIEPQLSVVLFRRLGWTRREWDTWAEASLRDGLGFVAPTRWQGEDVGRFVFLHPNASLDAVGEMLRRCVAIAG